VVVLASYTVVLTFQAIVVVMAETCTFPAPELSLAEPAHMPKLPAVEALLHSTVFVVDFALVPPIVK
jgi:hypothetical protein